jgi:hypothetical protein
VDPRARDERDPIVTTIEAYRTLGVVDGQWSRGEKHARILERRGRGGEPELAAGAHVNADQRAKAWLKIAIGVLHSITAYVCPAIPVRPASLADDDDDLRGALRAAWFARKRSAPDKRLLGDFAAWRLAVWSVEETAVGHVQAVAFAWVAFRAAGDHEAARAMRAFLEEEYLLPVDAQAPGDVLDVPRFATRTARRRFVAIMPAALSNYMD